MVLFEVKWLGRLQRGTTASQERCSSHLCWIFFKTIALEYDMRLAMQCSSILCVLFEIKVVKCKLCESSSRFVGMKMPPRAVCSSTHFDLVVIHLWTLWKLVTTLLYFRVEQSPCSCSLGMCNAISMCFGVGKTSWARLITYSYCLGLKGHHYQPQGRHPLSAMPSG